MTADPSAAPGRGAVVEMRDVAVAIGGRPVLRGVDLVVREGELVALLGANGSGKSTLVRAVTGLRPVATGTVEVFGTPLSRFRDWGRVGFVPQRPGAVGGVPSTVREVVASGRVSRRRVLRPPGRADRRIVDRAIATVGLTDRAGEGVSTLSGGQQQRVLIARALAGEPDLLLLDEPTAGVDLPNQRALAATLGTLKEDGATMLLVSHELGPLAHLVDRTVVLRDGRVVYDGPPLDQAGVHEAHHHHHPPAHHGQGSLTGEPHDHAPHVGSPLDDLADGPRS